jgi:hypothetical protein
MPVAIPHRGGRREAKERTQAEIEAQSARTSPSAFESTSSAAHPESGPRSKSSGLKLLNMHQQMTEQPTHLLRGLACDKPEAIRFPPRRTPSGLRACWNRINRCQARRPAVVVTSVTSHITGDQRPYDCFYLHFICRCWGSVKIPTTITKNFWNTVGQVRAVRA